MEVSHPLKRLVCQLQLYGDYTMNVACIGSDRPSLRELHNHVVINVADKWRDLGVQLLRPGQEKILDIIAANHPHDVVSCCKHVLKIWLDTTTDATWNELIRALRSPTIQLDYEADRLDQILTVEGKIYSYTYNSISISASDMFFQWKLQFCLKGLNMQNQFSLGINSSCIII